MGDAFWEMMLWVVVASGLGFAISAVFAGWFKLARRRFLFFYTGLAGVFLVKTVRKQPKTQGAETTIQLPPHYQRL